MRRSRAAQGSLAFFVLGPGVIVGVIPFLLTRWNAHQLAAWWPVAQLIGIVLVLAGLLFLAPSFRRFVVDGLGTPMPAAPPTRLVVTGLYRYVRNPMYVGLLWILFGQTLILGRLSLLIFTLLLWAFSAAFVHWREEPVLVRRFGDTYVNYRRAVPAWWPRLRAWHA